MTGRTSEVCEVFSPESIEMGVDKIKDPFDLISTITEVPCGGFVTLARTSWMIKWKGTRKVNWLEPTEIESTSFVTATIKFSLNISEFVEDVIT